MMDGDNNFNRAWEQQRRRPGGCFEVRIWGFGRGARDDQFHLWVPDSTPGDGSIFADGKTGMRLPTALMRNPRIAILRDRLSAGFQRRNDLLELFQIGLVLHQYAVAVLNANYRSPGMDGLSEEDLAYALGGEDWIDGMVEHAMRPDRIIVDLDAMELARK